MNQKIGRVGRVFMCLPLFLFLLAHDAAAKPSLSAQSSAAIDVETGRILYSKQGNERMRVASLTKIMTAIVAIEEGDLKKTVSTPEYAVGTEGSSIYLRAGEKLTLEQLLYGLMLRSGNDVAVTIADHIGGSLEGFAQLMNEKAEYLGLSGTHFTNPHGLDDSTEHYSTAVDLAKLTAYAMQNEEFHKISATKTINIPQEGGDWDRKLLNKNKMLRLYKGADGVKTGYTKLAGRCLVSSATREGRQVAVVTLNAPNDWDDHSQLLNYGFREFTPVELINEQEPVVLDPPLYAVQSFSYPLESDERKNIHTEVVMQNTLKRLLPGAVSGYVHVYLNEEEVGKVGLTPKKEPVKPVSTLSSVENHTPVQQEMFERMKSLVWGAW